MSLRDDLARVLARDPRYPIQAYGFLLEALEFTKTLKQKTRDRRKRAGAGGKGRHHVSGRELCLGARELAQRQFGLMALTVLRQWGLYATSDLGEMVYNLIASGDLEASPNDSRADFDGVYDFEDAFGRDYIMVLDDVA